MSDYTITRRVKVNGSLADADSLPVLRDATATYGIRRVDTGEVLVGVTPSPVEMTRASLGVYTYTFTAAELGVIYQYAVEVVVGGDTYRKTDTFALSSTDEDLEVEVALDDASINDVIRKNLANPAAAAADGQSASQHNLRDQIAAAEWLKRQEAAASGSLGGLKFIKLAGPGME